VSMSKTKCNTCNTNGHESSKCTESWRQFHSIVSDFITIKCVFETFQLNTVKIVVAVV